jgi:hypothetical protein
MQPIEVFPVLMGAHGDAPWLTKLACGCGHSACNGCWRCGIVGATEAPNQTKLNSVAFGGYAEEAPCRTYDREANSWLGGEVLYAKDAPLSGPVLDRKEAARLKVQDDIFILRGNTAAQISDEEMSACHQRILDGEGTVPSRSIQQTLSKESVAGPANDKRSNLGMCKLWSTATGHRIVDCLLLLRLLAKRRPSELQANHPSRITTKELNGGPKHKSFINRTDFNKALVRFGCCP